MNSKSYNSTNLKTFMAGLIRRNPNEEEFSQSVHEVAEVIIPYLRKHPDMTKHVILERMTEPDRVFMFRVIWEDDQGHVRVNRGYRVQFNNSLGPYKGGLRFHPSVNLSILKFLAFEQTFKNALTGLPLGAAKGGADFNPRGKSDAEVLRFCKSFMLELFRYIGPNVDVPAGDIGVGEREIGYLFGQYKRITGEFASGVLTGKAINTGGSLIRKEATGYGVVYFTREMLDHHNDSIEGKTCIISGSGNVAQYCAEKVIHLGGKVLTLSDSDGFIHDKDGINLDKLEFVKELKESRQSRISEYTKRFKKASYHAGKRPWGVSGQLAFPCATQNEIDVADAKKLISNGCLGVIEGANMPTTLEATHLLISGKKIFFAPAKAANAGGVAISGLEMSQNSLRMSWDNEQMGQHLQSIMKNIHLQCVQYGSRKGSTVDYITGANLASFVRVANAMLSHGV